MCQRNHRTRRKRKQKSSLQFSSVHPTRTSARAVKRLTSMDDTSSSSHILLVTVDRPACHHLSKDLLLTRLIHNAPQAHRAGSSRCSGPPALGHRVRTGGKELPVTHCSLSFLASTRIVLRIVALALRVQRLLFLANVSQERLALADLRTSEQRAFVTSIQV